MAVVPLVPSSALLSDACKQEQLCCSYQHQIWFCVSLTIYVVILASLKKKNFPPHVFLFWVVMKSASFLWIFSLSLCKLSKATTLSQLPLPPFIFVPSLFITCLKGRDDARIRFPISRLGAANSVPVIFLYYIMLKAKKFPKIRDSGLDSDVFTCTLNVCDQSWDILPGLQLLCRGPPSSIFTMSANSISKSKISENKANSIKNQSVPNWIMSLG